MNAPNDFFAKRLAAIEQENARRLAPIEEKASRGHVTRLGRVIPVVVACIKEMRAAELSEREIADLLRAAADALDQSFPHPGSVDDPERKLG
jgi:hypothetical protein